ncbi:MAG TPA: VOC family protein [Gemmatimonadaceae bacterium]|nr:VOC family protein [Gemmatimonadaceae bacterium]
MVQRIDHLVIAVRDLALASADYRRAGFTVTPGGEHTSGGTRNALIAFADGAYFELIAFMEPDRPQAHRWWPRLARGEGLIDFALGAADLTTTADALRGRGFHVEGPTDGGRTRPDGQRLAWRTILLSDAAQTPLPFVIEDVTPRVWRVPDSAAADHPLGVTRVDGVTVVVSDLARSATAFAELIGTVGVPDTPTIAGVRTICRFPLGDQWIALAEPDQSASEIRQHLEQRGAGPYEVVVGGPIASVGNGQLLPLGATHGARIRIARQGRDEAVTGSAGHVSREAMHPPAAADRATSTSAQQDETYMRRCLELARRVARSAHSISRAPRSTPRSSRVCCARMPRGTPASGVSSSVCRPAHWVA